MTLNTNRELLDWLDSYVELTENTEPPIMFRLWVGISCIAAVLQRKCRIDWGSLTFYPNLYVTLVAPPGKARKGTAMKVGKKMLEDLGIKLAAESITREALVRELQEANNTEVNAKTGVMESHSSLTIYSEELAVFLGAQNSQLIMDLTDWFDCSNQWIYRTKGQGTDNIIGVWVNLLGATTPSLLRTMLPMDAVGGGLVSRMIFVYEPRRGKIIPYPDWGEKEVKLREKLIRDLERIRNLRGGFKITEQFILNWSKWYMTQQEDCQLSNDPNLASYVERRPAHLMKLCMILSASRSDNMIMDEIDFNRARKILEATERKMSYALRGVGKSAHSDVLTRVWTEIAMRGETTFQELITIFYNDADKRVLEQILETLQSMQVIKIIHTGHKTIIRHCKGGIAAPDEETIHGP